MAKTEKTTVSTKKKSGGTKHPELELAGAGMRIDIAGGITKHCTNIMSFEVPEALDTVVPTGIEWLNAALGGGWTPSTVALVTGGPGAGKTTMTIMLGDAMTGADCVVAYFGSEESVVQTRKVTKRLDCKHGFIVDDCDLVDRCPTWKNDDRRSLMDHITAIRDQNGRLVPYTDAHGVAHKKYVGKQIVIIVDSLQSHDDGWYYNGYTNSKTQVRVAEKFAAVAKNEEFGYPIIILVGQVTKNGDFAGPQQLKHAIDLHAELKIDTGKESDTRGKRLFQIVKNRFGCTGMTVVLDMVRQGLVEENRLMGL